MGGVWAVRALPRQWIKTAVNELVGLGSLLLALLPSRTQCSFPSFSSFTLQHMRKLQKVLTRCPNIDIGP